MTKSIAPMPLVEAFEKRTSTALSNMRNRFGPKFGKNGRMKGKLIRPGLVVPIELPELRSWVLRSLGGKPDGCGSCAYCRRPIDAMNFRLDHAVPVSRGGSLEVENLAVCCDDCNRIKGKMTVGEFVQLLELLRHFDPTAERDVMERLKMGEGFRRMRFFKKPEAKKEPIPEGSLQIPLEEPW